MAAACSPSSGAVRGAIAARLPFLSRHWGEVGAAGRQLALGGRRAGAAPGASRSRWPTRGCPPRKSLAGGVESSPLADAPSRAGLFRRLSPGTELRGRPGGQPGGPPRRTTRPPTDEAVFFTSDTAALSPSRQTDRLDFPPRPGSPARLHAPAPGAPAPGPAASSRPPLRPRRAEWGCSSFQPQNASKGAPASPTREGDSAGAAPERMGEAALFRRRAARRCGTRAPEGAGAPRPARHRPRRVKQPDSTSPPRKARQVDSPFVRVSLVATTIDWRGLHPQQAADARRDGAGATVPRSIAPRRRPSHLGPVTGPEASP